MTIRVVLLLTMIGMSTLAMADDGAAGMCGKERFRFIVVPKKDVREQVSEFQPLADLLSEGLGVPVEILPASSYDGVMDAIISGAADMAVMGPASYILGARREPGLLPFASLAVEGGAYTPAGSSYYSLLLVHDRSDVKVLDDLQGSRVALGDPSSTSGTLVPKVSLPDLTGASLENFFGTQVYTGGHDRALNALLEGRVDAAFVSSSRVDEYVRRGLVAEDTFRVMWQSESLHYDPFVFSASLCESVQAQVKALMMTPSEQREQFLDNVNATAITNVSREDFRIIEKLIPAE